MANSNGLIKKLCVQDETITFEAKRVSGKMVHKALTTISAFANTDGGILVLGLEDLGKATGEARLFGVEENMEAVDELKRKLESHIIPPIEGVQWLDVPFETTDRRKGTLQVVEVTGSTKVHSIQDGGTWKRLESSNRQMTATEINALCYARGVITAEAELVEVDFDLLDTDAWRLYCSTRGLATGSIEDRLRRIGLAKTSGNQLLPTRAVVLLFADEPSGLLARKAAIRIFHYSGTKGEYGDTPNLLKTPRTISGPLIMQIADAYEYVLNEIASGLTLARSGFETMHRYPVRAIREAITNAVIHRDYHINRDIHIRIFDNRIEIESPGLFIGGITPRTIRTLGSISRNPLIVNYIRDFPDPPNIDAGEGVRMMYSAMKAVGLYPPFYFTRPTLSSDVVEVWLMNEEQPPVWDQVNSWIERHGSIANRNLRAIANVDTLKASKMLKQWVEHGLLVADDSKGKRGMVYRLPGDREESQTLLSNIGDNKLSDG